LIYICINFKNMCGIAGIIAINNMEISESRLKKMTDIIAHRGPDGDGQWISVDGNVGLGHRRLSIIDLSHEADQPMHYLNRYSIVFNGEIYNYIELKETLLKQSYTFKTQSDTEVLMALYDRDKEKCLQLLDGMFSFVIYDKKENTVFCARDRFGEKPFFYNYEKGKHFMFGSEMKCLWAGGVPKETNNKMLFNYMAYGFLDNPADLSETFYTNCLRLPHSHFIKININTLEIKIERYYDIEWKNVNHSITEKQASEQFKELFYTSVSRRLRSDVPVGSSLSGGLDSSLVVCVIDELKRGSNQRQDTFSAVFPGFKKDERKYMDYVTNVTNVNPHYVTPTDEEMIQELDKVAYHQEEPFGSASIFVQYKVMELAKKNNVTVLLDGQGADEILAGYHHYYPSYFNELKKINTIQYRQEIQAYKKMHGGSEINESVIGGWKNKVKSFLPTNSSALRLGYEKYKHFKNPMLTNEFFNEYYQQSFKRQYSFEGLNHSLYSSTMQHGLQELLRYADRNSMAHSREVRLPFLSHEVVEFLFSLPATFKIKEGWTKWIMRETFDTTMPKEIAWRKDKIGYEPPQKSWMESEEMKKKIDQSRKKLVDNNYLLKNTISNNTSDKIVKSNNEKSWTHLMAGNI
jgi:asparagine synthase (glutamine-hydrolysing)